MKTSISSLINLKLAILVLSAAFLFGCKTNTTNVEPSQKDDFVDLTVNSDFKFITTKEINIHLEIMTSNPDEPSHKFSIYQNDPDNGGSLIVSGVTDPYNVFETTVTVPAWIDILYIQNQDVNNSIETITVDATSSDIYYTFNSGLMMSQGFKTVSNFYTDPGCNSCDETISSGTYNKITINNNKTYCIESGSNVTVSNKIEFKGGTLIVCGNLTTNKYQANSSGGDFVISTNGTLSIGNANMDKDIDNFINFGIASISGSPTIQDMNFENHGTMNISGNVNIQTEDFFNTNILNIAGNVNNNEEGYNSGTMTVSGHFNNNSNTEFTNDCKLIITGNFNQNDIFNNNDNAYVQVNQNTTFNGSSETNLGVQSLISTTNLTINNDLIGPSVLGAKITISNTTNINGSGDITGYIDICDADGVENNNGSTGSNVTFDCSTYIPATSCNPGSGAPSDPDTDGDGVPDAQDAYPSDPNRATNEFYPNENDFSSLACEDLWTNYGDYDFNDLVVLTNYKIVKNAQNEVVELYGKFHIAAVGATLNNGFGIEFDVPSTEVLSIAGTQINGSAVSINTNGTENGSTNNAVMIVYSAVNDYLGTAMVNTIQGGNSMEIDTINIHMMFTSPQTSIGTPPYNPFMFIDQIRGKEIHKIDHAPTELFDIAYFGEGEDDSDPTIDRYYVSNTNLPWVIEIPESFVWPKENADILTAYLKFQEWAESSGTLYPDWYKDLPGYRNDDNLYEQD